MTRDDVPSLAHLLGTNKEDVPCIYLLHPDSEQMIKYPRKLDNETIFTPELLLAWADRTRLEMSAFDVILPDLLSKRLFPETLAFLTKHKIVYEKARLKVRKCLKEVGEDANLYNAGIKDIVKNVWD